MTALKVKDGLGDPQTLKASDDGADKVPHHNVDTLPAAFTSDTSAIKTAVQAMSALISGSRLPVSLSATVEGYLDGLEGFLSTLAGAVSAGRLAVDLTTAVTTAISTIATAIGTAAAQEHTTAASPHSVRLSTGSAFYDGAKTGQLPSGLGPLSGGNSLSIVHATTDTLVVDSSSTSSMTNGSSISGNTAGKLSAGFTLAGGGSLVGTLVVEVALGNWESTYFIDPFTGAQSSSLVVSSPVSDVFRGIFVPPGASQVRVKVSAWTSGTSTGYLGFSNANPLLGLQSTYLPPAATIYDGNKNVTTAGTRVVLASSQALTKGVRVRAKDANTGLIYIGGASVSSGSDRLAPGEPIWMDTNNLANVWLDAAVNGEGVTFSAW